MSWALAVVQALLFGDATPPDCKDIPCLIDARFAKDAKAKSLAQDLYKATGDIAGLGVDEIMDGGYRGKIHLVPEPPVGTYRKHLEWVGSAATRIDAFFTKLADGKELHYRWRDLGFRFVRSVGKHTPSAYAFIGDHDVWTVVYNVEGSLLTSETGVRETIFHELFHINDEAHDNWSAKTLKSDFDAIVKKCGSKVACYAPFAPNDTKVRATGMYYAFQPNNGDVVHEYAAELAVRFFKEQSEVQATGKLSAKAFKCGPAENARAWQALVDEFFVVDHVPAC
ncbi:MAG: hypothetical protein QM831_10225 [Kofleriaceae bacterium]